MTPALFSAKFAPWLRLLATPSIGAITAAKLLRHFGSPEAIFNAQPNTLEALVGPAKAQALCHVPSHFENDLARTYKWLCNAPALSRRALWHWHDPAYPPALLEIEDPPLVLFVQGATQWVSSDSVLWHQQLKASIAIVGSRSPTQQGKENAKKFATQLREQGICIVSGLALGIDTAAHEGALLGKNHQGPCTIAVLGTGLDKIYPARNETLYHAVSQTGLVMSEQLLGTSAQAHHFPRRNRIITGISQGTLVVEAALKSGSLISARLAAEQGREVFAIPGSIYAHQAKGCHQLIKQGAKLVENLEDILEELAPMQAHSQQKTATPHAFSSNQLDWTPSHTPQMKAAETSLPPQPEGPSDQKVMRILDCMGSDPIGFDALMDRTGIPAHLLQAQLLDLELQGQIEKLPGGLYQQIHWA